MPSGLGACIFVDEDERIYAIVRLIPSGRVMAYGHVAAEVGASARTVGRVIAFASDTDKIPWHRVVGSDGTLRIARRSPVLAREQRERLEREGILFEPNGRIAAHYFVE